MNADDRTVDRFYVLRDDMLRDILHVLIDQLKEGSGASWQVGGLLQTSSSSAKHAQFGKFRPVIGSGGHATLHKIRFRSRPYWRGDDTSRGLQRRRVFTPTNRRRQSDTSGRDTNDS